MDELYQTHIKNRDQSSKMFTTMLSNFSAKDENVKTKGFLNLANTNKKNQGYNYLASRIKNDFDLSRTLDKIKKQKSTYDNERKCLNK